jgi:hypothetical protein
MGVGFWGFILRIFGGLWVFFWDFWGESLVFLTTDCTECMEWEFLQVETEVKDSLCPLLPSVGMGSVQGYLTLGSGED